MGLYGRQELESEILVTDASNNKNTGVNTKTRAERTRTRIEAHLHSGRTMGIGMPKICGEYMNEKNAIEAARERVESGRVERPTKRERE